MSAITGEGAIQTAPGGTLAKRGSNGCSMPALRGLLALAAARYGYEWWSVGRFIESTDDAYAGGNVTPISPHVAGFVAQILVADNDYVHAGQPLVRLDDRDFQAAVDRAAAILAARQATPCQSRGERVAAANDHPPGEGGPRRQDGASGLRQTRRRQVSPARAFERRIATKRGEGVRAE